MGLALVEGDRLVGNWGFEGTAQALSSAGDVNGDGRDEIVFVGEFGMGGQVSRSMTLATFGSVGPEDIGGTSIMESSCAAGAGGGTSSATRVTADGPELLGEHFTQRCDGGAWASAGPPGPLRLEPVGDLRYVSLTGPAPARPGPAGAPRVERGRLEAGDATLNTGEYVDAYEAACRRGRPIVVDLRSVDMDPYLIVRLPDGSQVDNDDHEGDLTHSRVEATPPSDGTCSVLVTSFEPGGTGAYELSIDIRE
jgi:hypothetical protein